MRAVVERAPVGFHLHTDLQFRRRAVDDVGNEVDPDVERDAHHRVGLGAAERRRCAVGDGVGEHHALARYLAPFDVAPSSGEDAHRPREVLVLAGGLAILDDELLLLRPFPIGLGKVEVLDRALDAERIVECFGHARLAYPETTPTPALGPHLRPYLTHPMPVPSASRVSLPCRLPASPCNCRTASTRLCEEHAA